MKITDFHTHILPNVDDGSASVEMSLAMLQKEAEQGIERVVLTPHFYARHDNPSRFIARRRAAEDKLRTAVQTQDGLPEIEIGAEVHYFEGISECEFLPELAIGSTKCVMVEMPMGSWSDRMLRELASIQSKQGLTPIVAHLDRYFGRFTTHHLPERLAELPILIQVNSSFFIKSGTRSLAFKLLRRGCIDLLGSDCHDLEHRPPNLGEALSLIVQKLGGDALARIKSNESNLFGES